MQRRTFLQLSAATAFIQLTGCGGGGMNMGGMGGMNGIRPLGNASQLPKPLAIQPVLTGTTFNLSIQSGSMTFLAGKTTPTYGINGAFLGPTLKVRNGEVVTMHVTNNLTEATTLHWHGMRLPANMDGGPHQVIEPGATWHASFTVIQKAGTNWFHPHLEDHTGRQVFMGIAGLLIVEDADTDALDLPKTWGVDDIPLILQDRLFKADGSFDYLPLMHDEMNGMKGDTLLCNGMVNAYVDLPAKQVRFRILNGSNARVYQMEFSDGRQFKQIASDNALLASPVSLSTLTLSPGERTEIVVDLTGDQNKSLTLLDRLSGATLLTLNATPTSASTATLPATLTTLPALNPENAVRTRIFSLTMKMEGMAVRFLINGLSNDKTRIDFSVKRDDIEIWEIRNDETDGMVHNFHIHGAHFQILERDGSAANVAAYEKGYKDTVLINSGKRVKIIIQMTDYTTTAAAPYMFHCHILEHEDRGMIGQFIVEA